MKLPPRTSAIQVVSAGAYVWKIMFVFKGGKNEVRYIRTGLIRAG